MTLSRRKDWSDLVMWHVKTMPAMLTIHTRRILLTKDPEDDQKINGVVRQDTKSPLLMTEWMAKGRTKWRFDINKYFPLYKWWVGVIHSIWCFLQIMKSFWCIFCQLFQHKQEAVQDQFLNVVQLVWIQSFPSPWLVSISRLK